MRAGRSVMGPVGLAVCLLVGCGGGGAKVVGPPAIAQLLLVETHVLSIPEPSDVTIDNSGTRLWMVGNHPEKVYELDRSGHVVKTLAYTGQDLEGVVFDARDSTLWVAEENLRQVVHLDLNGAVLSTHALALTGEHNSGLEGICLNDGGQMFVLNEKHPGMFIDLNARLDIASKDTLSFARDYSGMCFNHQMGCFWIVSDQSEGLYLFNEPNHVIAEYPLPFPKPEGVAFDPVASLVYVVSDSTNTMYVFRHTPGSAALAAR